MNGRKAPCRAGLVLGLALCLAACRPVPTAEPAVATAESAGMTAAPNGEGPDGTGLDGAALYARYCALCHGADGRSVESVPAAPHLNSQALLTAADDAFLAAAIAQGRPGPEGRGKPGTKMPAFGTDPGRILSDAQVDAIVAFMRAWQTEPSLTLEPYSAAGGNPEAGAQTYQAQCADCHGADGWGIEAPRLAGSVFQATASDALIRQVIAKGRPGSTMEAFALDEAAMADLIAFIRTLPQAGASP